MNFVLAGNDNCLSRLSDFVDTEDKLSDGWDFSVTDPFLSDHSDELSQLTVRCKNTAYFTVFKRLLVHLCGTNRVLLAGTRLLNRCRVWRRQNRALAGRRFKTRRVQANTSRWLRFGNVARLPILPR